MHCLEMALLLQCYWLKNNSHLPQVMGLRYLWRKGILLVEVTQLLKSCFEELLKGHPSSLAFPAPRTSTAPCSIDFVAKAPGSAGRSPWPSLGMRPFGRKPFFGRTQFKRLNFCRLGLLLLCPHFIPFILDHRMSPLFPISLFHS